jgi:PleD family two-component response regulator
MQPRASKRPVVLIVEDETLARMSAIEAIEAAGFDVIEACDADEAISILEQRSDIRLVFTDIQMPGSMDGLKLAHFEGPLAADKGHCNFRPSKDHRERLARRQPLSVQTLRGGGDRERDRPTHSTVKAA